MKQFTRDEAIAIVDKELEKVPYPQNERGALMNKGIVRGIRLALEALAAAGVFSDDPVTIRPGRFFGKAETMADKLDAAGIR